MAVTIHDIIHAQVGNEFGYENVFGHGGVVTSSPAPKSTAEKYMSRLSNGSGGNFGRLGCKPVTPSADDYLHAFTYVVFETIDPEKTSASFFAALSTVSGSPHWDLHWNADGDMILNDANGGIIQTVTGVFSVDTVYKIRVKWRRGNSAVIDVWVDEVNKISKTAEDLASSTANATYVTQTNSSNPAFIVNVFHGTGGFASATDISDVVFEGDILTFPGDGWIDTSQAAASQWASTDALDGGRWDNMDDILTSSEGSYTLAGSSNTVKEGGVTTDDGARSGPKDDLGSGTIIGASWGWQWEREGEVKGSPTVFTVRGLYGKQASGSESTQNTTEHVMASSTIATPTHDRIFVGGTTDPVPNINEWFQIGFKVTHLNTDPIAGVFHGYHMSTFLHLEIPFTGGPGRRVCVDGVVITL